MRKPILTLLLHFFLAHVLSAQVGGQHKLLAAHHILQRFTYSCLVDQGRLTGDSTLVEITRYNFFPHYLYVCGERSDNPRNEIFKDNIYW